MGAEGIHGVQLLAVGTGTSTGGPIHVHGGGGAATYSRYVGWVSS